MTQKRSSYQSDLLMGQYKNIGSTQKVGRNSYSLCITCNASWYRRFLLSLLVILIFVLVIQVAYAASPSRVSISSMLKCMEPENYTEPVPKIIHQIYDSLETVPKKWVAAAKTCTDVYSDYLYKFWRMEDIEDLILKHYKWFYITWKNYPHLIERVDAGKYLILHHDGGMYLDIDVSCVKSYKSQIDSLNRHQHTILRHADPSGLGAEVMIARPGNGYYERVLHEMLHSSRHYPVKYMTVMFSTGPHFLGTVYSSYPCKHALNLVPDDILTKEYFIHHHNSGWHGWDGYLITAIYYNLDLIVAFVICLICIVGVMFLVRHWRRRRGLGGARNSDELFETIRLSV